MALLTQKKSGIISTENLLPLFVVISLGLNALCLLAMLILGAVTARLANRPVPTLVQTVNGESILTESMDHLDRTPETIRSFTKDALTMMFTWSPLRQAGGQVNKDEGIEGWGIYVPLPEAGKHPLCCLKIIEQPSSKK